MIGAALLPRLERALSLAVAHDRIIAAPRADAPDTLQGIRDGFTETAAGFVVPVWNGASDRTIWSGPAANFAFRAWHDAHHAREGFALDYPGERAAAEYAAAALRPFLRSAGCGRESIEARALAGEVWGQVLFHSRHGRFPVRQRAFVTACVAQGIERAAACPSF